MSRGWSGARIANATYMGSVNTAVIPAAGLGTRFLPVAKAVPKELLPILDRPMLQYVVEEAVASGIQSIVVITSRGKASLEDYFDRSVELEQALEEAGKSSLLEEVQRASRLAHFSYVRQGEPRGLGHAVLTAGRSIEKGPFAVILPDDIIISDVPAMGRLIDVFDRYGGSVVAVEEVERERLSSYGVVDVTPLEDDVYRLRSLVEKPSPEEAPSNLAIVGRYVFTPELLSTLERTPPGAGGEIQLTDGIALLLKEQPIYACRLHGRRHDVGTPLGLLRASLEFALARDDMRPQVEKLIAELASRRE